MHSHVSKGSPGAHIPKYSVKPLRTFTQYVGIVTSRPVIVFHVEEKLSQEHLKGACKHVTCAAAHASMFSLSLQLQSCERETNKYKTTNTSCVTVAEDVKRHEVGKVNVNKGKVASVSHR